jgi:uncharacterized protein YjbI with pentapeptide repeats
MQDLHFSIDWLKQELQGLPPRAIIAFVARIARRAHHEFFEFIQVCVEYLDRFANGEIEVFQKLVYYEDYSRNELDYADDADYCDYVVVDAVKSACSAVSQEQNNQQHSNAINSAAHAAYESTIYRIQNITKIVSPRAAKAVRGDIEFLKKACSQETFDFKLESFGPLWLPDELSDSERQAHPDFEGNIFHLRLLLKFAHANKEDRISLSNELKSLDRPALFGAKLNGINLSGVKLKSPNFIRASFDGAKVERAELVSADFRGANLASAKFRNVNLKSTNFTSANLKDATFASIEISGACFDFCRLGGTVLIDTDMSQIVGLENCIHSKPSVIDRNSLIKNSNLPRPFFYGCGLSDWEIEATKLFDPALRSEQRVDILYEIHRLQEDQPIQFFSIFISYSNDDKTFAEKLYEELQNVGVRCWYAPKNIKPGQKIHEQIDSAIQSYDRLLLILSKSSMQSNWVKTEIANAMEKERDQGRKVLFPVRIVKFDSVLDWKCFNADQGIDSAREVREYFIPDFTNWDDPDSFSRSFERLLTALRVNDTLP